MTIAVRATTLRETLGLKETPLNGPAWHKLLLSGLPYKSLTLTAKALHMGDKALGALLDISPRTLAARKKSRRLSATESDLVYAIARVYVRMAGLKSPEVAAAWMVGAAPELKGGVPLELLRTRLGTEYVMTYLGRERDEQVAKSAKGPKMEKDRDTSDTDEE